MVYRLSSQYSGGKLFLNGKGDTYDMEKMGLNEIRERFLKFFEGKGHLRLPSFSLVPQNDPSLLLINSGMAPLKPYFTGASIPPRRRVTTCQKCIRTPDIENVGKTARHGTFFEMLGNFSFGDYFKNEVIPWAWEFFTQEMKIPADRLYVTIYQDDDEAFRIWHDVVGLPADRIIRMGKEDNFWEHGTGPCGPCSEIHYDRGAEHGCGKPDCRVGCDCDRFIEVWNLVFTQFDRQEDGSYKKLDHPNIDTGMGLERLACVMQEVENLFEVDTVRRILDTVCGLAQVSYGKEWQKDVSIRVITDHIRSTVMMIGDGVVPSNEARGYVLRRLLRRAARHGMLLGIKGLFLSDLAKVVIEESGGAYPNLVEKQDYICKIIRIEEERFAATVDQGMQLLNNLIQDKKEKGDLSPLAGEEAFKLHDTYGFPLDLTKEILAENGLELDEAAFHSAMKVQKDKAREAIKDRKGSWGDGNFNLPADCPATRFLGYETLQAEAQILYLARTDAEGTTDFVSRAGDGDSVLIVTDQTPFYAESGGQVGDVGTLTTAGAVVRIVDTQKTAEGCWKHQGIVESGVVEQGETCQLQVDRMVRLATERNHSATHLLQKALRNVLGDHVHQSGSYVTSERLRFDFNHMQAVTPEELARVEEEVNRAISQDDVVSTQVLSLEEAKQSGATALFDEKYGDVVRVVSMGDYSKEFCGGTHVKNTASIGLLKIVHEGGVAAGIRRIMAVTGNNARLSYQEEENRLCEVADYLKVTPADVLNKVTAVQTQYRAMQKELESLKRSIAGNAIQDLLDGAAEVNGVKVITGRFDLLDGEGLREMAEKIRDKMEIGLVLLASGKDDKVQLVAMATKSAVAKGVSCGNVIRKAAQLCGGGGGGRPDMAQAGGKNAAAIDAMLASVPSLVAGA